MSKISDTIAQYAIKYDGSWEKIAMALRLQEEPGKYPVAGNFITIADEAYPRQLRQLRYPPFILFYKGNPALLQKPMMTVVGARNCTEYGEQTCREICAILGEHFVLVSGLARGIDRAVHESSLRSVAVIGNGLDIAYPTINRDLYERVGEQGLILSEYPPGSKPLRSHFPWRNRILAALGQGTVVVQAASHSGSSITAKEAFALGKDVYCVPYPLHAEEGAGCNHLIADGALIIDELDVLKDLRPVKVLT